MIPGWTPRSVCHEKQSPRYSGLIGGSAIPIPNVFTSRRSGLSFSDIGHKRSLLALRKKIGKQRFQQETTLTCHSKKKKPLIELTRPGSGAKVVVVT